MADLHGFMNVTRQEAERRPVEERVQDWKEVYPGGPGHALLPIITDQASRSCIHNRDRQLPPQRQ